VWGVAPVTGQWNRKPRRPGLAFEVVQGDALVIGRTYAYREKRTTASPLLKVKLVDKVGRKSKVKIRWRTDHTPASRST
jgi:hypothetical protein